LNLRSKNSGVKEPCTNCIRFAFESKKLNFFLFLFSGRTFGLGARGAHRQAQAGSTVLLQIQTGSFGDPPTPSALDLSLASDQY
jgi:hypothetical protein